MCSECNRLGTCKCFPGSVIQKIVPYVTATWIKEPDSKPEFVGVMPLRTDMEVLPIDHRVEEERKRILLAAGFDPTDSLRLGWVAHEVVGIAMFNAG